MALAFQEVLRLRPVPGGAGRAARQALAVRHRLTALGGDYSLLRAEAIHAITNASPEDEPSELRRLRLLYQHAYTEAELGALVDAALRALGITPGGEAL